MVSPWTHVGEGNCFFEYFPLNLPSRSPTKALIEASFLAASSRIVQSSFYWLKIELKCPELLTSLQKTNIRSISPEVVLSPNIILYLSGQIGVFSVEKRMGLKREHDIIACERPIVHGRCSIFSSLQGCHVPAQIGLTLAFEGGYSEISARHTSCRFQRGTFIMYIKGR